MLLAWLAAFGGLPHAWAKESRNSLLGRVIALLVDLERDVELEPGWLGLARARGAERIESSVTGASSTLRSASQPVRMARLTTTSWPITSMPRQSRTCFARLGVSAASVRKSSSAAVSAAARGAAGSRRQPPTAITLAAGTPPKPLFQPSA